MRCCLADRGDRMSEAIRSWIMVLAGVIVFGSVCEMILPSGAYKKYVQLAIGLMLVLAVIKPFADDGFSAMESVSVSSAYDDAMKMDERQREDIIKIYKNRLAEKMSAEIKDVAGVEFMLRCEVSEDEENFGSVKKVFIAADAKDNIKVSDDAVELIKLNYGLSDSEIEVKYIDDK